MCIRDRLNLRQRIKSCPYFLPSSFRFSLQLTTICHERASSRFRPILIDDARFSSTRKIEINLKNLIHTRISSCLISECEYKYISRTGGPQNGTFSAPRITNPFNHSFMCVYIFFAGPHQKVEITFQSFNLRGTPPE